MLHTIGLGNTAIATLGIVFWVVALFSFNAAGIEPRGMPRWVRPIWPVFRWLQRRGSAEKAASSSIFLASTPEAASITGTYIGSNARPARPSEAALDRANQEKTWELVVQLSTNAPTAICTDHIIADRTAAATPVAVL